LASVASKSVSFASAPCLGDEPLDVVAPAPPARLTVQVCRCLSTRRPRLHPDHSPLGIGRQSAFRLVQQDEFVAKRIANARTPTNRDVERTLNALAARAQEERESLVYVGDQNVRLGSDLQVNDKLRVRLGKGEASRFIASPQKAVTELVAIKGDRRVKIGDAKQMIVEFSKQGCFKAHFKETPMELTRTGRPHGSQTMASVGPRTS
jgi:hypothetical protein